jgi:hypothetical protein
LSHTSEICPPIFFGCLFGRIAEKCAKLLVIKKGSFYDNLELIFSTPIKYTRTQCFQASG